MKSPSVEFCLELIRGNPVLNEVLIEHLADHYEEILPHLLLADVYRLIEKKPDAAPAILHYLNIAFSKSKKEINDLIAVGFVESIEDFDEVKKNAEWGDYNHLQEEWLRQREGLSNI